MKFIRKYYYMKFSEKNIPLNNSQKKKLENILYGEEYKKFLTKSDENYLIIKKEELIGFFFLNIERDFIDITSIYIFEEYRNKSIATQVINDIIFVARHNINRDINYIKANSFVESAMFFLKKGFDFYKINEKIDYKKKNVIIMYKKI